MVQNTRAYRRFNIGALSLSANPFSYLDTEKPSSRGQHECITELSALIISRLGVVSSGKRHVSRARMLQVHALVQRFCVQFLRRRNTDLVSNFFTALSTI